MEGGCENWTVSAGRETRVPMATIRKFQADLAAAWCAEDSVVKDEEMATPRNVADYHPDQKLTVFAIAFGNQTISRRI